MNFYKAYLIHLPIIYSICLLVKSVWICQNGKKKRETAMEKKKKANGQKEQCLLLAQLVEEKKGVVRGSWFMSQGKRKTWERIARQIKASLPLLLHQ